jgi:hypothetical protein
MLKFFLKKLKNNVSRCGACPPIRGLEGNFNSFHHSDGLFFPQIHENSEKILFSCCTKIESMLLTGNEKCLKILE